MNIELAQFLVEQQGDIAFRSVLSKHFPKNTNAFAITNPLSLGTVRFTPAGAVIR
jgi:hypothetical protein